VKKNLELAIKKKKIKKTAILLSCPFLIIGCFGFHKFYLRQAGYGILYILLSLVGISGLLALINFFQLILMSQDKFDVKYNPEFSYYSQFKFD
jgi:TM2 domain-containing membrane protein YozV